MFNPFAISRVGESETDTQQYSAPSGPYAAPSLEAGDAYTDEFGWAPHLALRGSTVEIPSAQRLGTIPTIQMYPNAVRPPTEYYGLRDADDARRHSVEDQDADGWEERKGIRSGDRRWADNPRLDPPPEDRPTMRMAPRSYSFTRYFDQLNRTDGDEPSTGAARRLNGMHFSMADHRRDYEIGGMAPQRTLRNTYRLEPGPWDAGIVDLPPEPVTVQARI